MTFLRVLVKRLHRVLCWAGAAFLLVVSPFVSLFVMAAAVYTWLLLDKHDEDPNRGTIFAAACIGLVAGAGLFSVAYACLPVAVVAAVLLMLVAPKIGDLLTSRKQDKKETEADV